MGAHNLKPETVAHFRLHTNPRWSSVCEIKLPRTGREVKFIYDWLADVVCRVSPPRQTIDLVTTWRATLHCGILPGESRLWATRR